MLNGFLDCFKKQLQFFWFFELVSYADALSYKMKRRNIPPVCYNPRKLYSRRSKSGESSKATRLASFFANTDRFTQRQSTLNDFLSYQETPVFTTSDNSGNCFFVHFSLLIRFWIRLQNTTQNILRNLIFASI